MISLADSLCMKQEHQLSPASDVSSEIRTIDKRSQQYQRNVSREKDRFDVFDVVYHLNKAAELINTPDQRILLAKLNLEAAIKGKNTLGTHTHTPFIDRNALRQRTPLFPPTAVLHASL